MNVRVSLAAALSIAALALLPGCKGDHWSSGPPWSPWSPRLRRRWRHQRHRDPHSAKLPDTHRRVFRELGGAATSGDRPERHHLEPADGDLQGDDHRRHPDRRPEQHLPEQHRDRAGPDQPGLLDRQAGAIREWSSEQVGQLHRDDGADARLGWRHGPRRTDPAQHRQHRHPGGQRRRDLRLHLLPRHHADQGPGRRDDGLGGQQQGGPRRPDLRPEPGAPADHPAVGQRARHRQQHPDRGHQRPRRAAGASRRRHLRLQSLPAARR